jgi:GGDEF domain-containing protein
MLSGVQVSISVSTGVELYGPGSGRSAEQLMAGADAAMYRAKRAGHTSLI